MLHTLKLLLPAIVPSWRFFDIIAPSPRIEFTLLNAEDDPPLEKREWREFRPCPAHLSFAQMLGHLFWNPWRNESLFLVSCAERILQRPTQHSEDEILKRIMRDLKADPINPTAQTMTYLQFRLLLIERKGTQLQKNVVFRSRIELLNRQSVS